MTKLSAQTLVTQAAGIIEDLILSGQLKVGTRLKETELEDMIGISRTPLREALLRLEGQGLIVTYPRKGRFVKEIDIKEISDISEVRIALEALTVRLVHRKITADDIVALQAILEKMEHALTEKDSSAFMEYHEKFHDKLISLSDNAWLEKELHTLRKLMRWHRFYFKYHDQNFNYSLNSHKLQLQMLSDPDCDEDELVKIDEETTRRGCELLLQHIRSSKSATPENKRIKGKQ